LEEHFNNTAVNTGEKSPAASELAAINHCKQYCFTCWQIYCWHTTLHSLLACSSFAAIAKTRSTETGMNHVANATYPSQLWTSILQETRHVYMDLY